MNAERLAEAIIHGAIESTSDCASESALLAQTIHMLRAAIASHSLNANVNEVAFLSECETRLTKHYATDYDLI